MFRHTCRRYRCPLCDLRSADRSSVTQHIRNKHSEHAQCDALLERDEELEQQVTDNVYKIGKTKFFSHLIGYSKL